MAPSSSWLLREALQSWQLSWHFLIDVIEWSLIDLPLFPLKDDPLSALDVHVGRTLLEEGIVKWLNGNKKTVILVTHQLQYLNRADLVSWENTILLFTLQISHGVESEATWDNDCWCICFCLVLIVRNLRYYTLTTPHVWPNSDWAGWYAENSWVWRGAWNQYRLSVNWKPQHYFKQLTFGQTIPKDVWRGTHNVMLTDCLICLGTSNSKWSNTMEVQRKRNFIVEQ